MDIEQGEWGRVNKKGIQEGHGTGTIDP